MAARRLLIVMLVLLGISSVIAVITPNPRQQEREERQQGETGASTPGGTDASGTAGTIGASGANGTSGATGSKGNDRPAGAAGGAGPIEARAGDEPENPATAGAVVRKVSASGEPETIELAPGRRLVLTVSSTDPTEVAIPRLGLNAFADRWAPARFDVMLPSRPGSFPVEVADPERKVAVIRSARRD